MNERSRIEEHEIDDYLDEQMTEDQRRSFEQRVVTDPAAQKEIAERISLDEALRIQLSPPTVSVEQVRQWLSAERTPTPRGPVWQRRSVAWIGLAIAASVVWLLVLSQWRGNPKMEPFFKPRALAQIYSETVGEGFRPYYHCDDEARFAATFAKRQGVPLRLAKMPQGRTMAGLSYLGGLSRNTTAMLCRVEGQPVMVFVDRREAKPHAVLTVPEDSALYVHAATIDDLVLYEVAPFPEPQILEFLEVADNRPIGESFDLR